MSSVLLQSIDLLIVSFESCFLIRGFWLPRTYFFFSGASWFSTSKFMLQKLCSPSTLFMNFLFWKLFQQQTLAKGFTWKVFERPINYNPGFGFFLKLFFMTVIAQVFWKFLGTLDSIKSIHVELFGFL